MRIRTLAIGTAVAALAAGTASAQELNIYAWADELPAEIVADFEAETGITVTVDTFDSNESLVAKLAAGASGYDLIEPSQYAVQILIKQDLIVPLDHAKLANYDNLPEVFRNVSFDPGNVYSIPYLTGSTGLAYNEDCVTEPITSWKALWDEKYAGRIYMLDNMLAAYIAGLQINGFSANSSDEAEIAKATESLIAQKPILAGYNSTNFADLVTSGEACIVQAWSGTVIQAMKDNPKVHYVLPEEGGTVWIDGFAIPQGAENLDQAYAFIDYILRPEVAAKVTTLSGVATANSGAKALLAPEIANNPAIYPPEDIVAKADFILDVGAAMKFYQDGWTRVKTAE
jgi:spermidine/putrescine transport system substrate-binding protein